MVFSNSLLQLFHNVPTFSFDRFVKSQLHHVDGLNQSELRRSFQMKVNQEQVITLVRNSGFTWEF